MKCLKQRLKLVASLGILLLAGCSNNPPATNSAMTPTPTASPAQPVTQTNSNMPKEAAGSNHPTTSQGGQVIESGPYHLELVTLKEAAGTHIDFYLQKGDNHQPIPNAKVTAQIQLPDGTQKTLALPYDDQGKHYAAVLPGEMAGEYKVAILSDIGGEKVNGRFTFKR